MAQILEVTSDLTTAEIEGTDPFESIMIKGMPWKVLTEIKGDEGIVLTSADGDQFIGDLEDWDEDYAYITVSLR